MKNMVLVGVLIGLAGLCLAGEGADNNGFIQVQPGVFEKHLPDGTVLRHGQGIGGVDYLLARVDRKMQELVQSGDAATVGRDQFGALLKERKRLEKVRARLEESQSMGEKAAGCLCQTTDYWAKVEYGYVGGFQASAYGAGCGSVMVPLSDYDAYSISVSVTSDSQFFQSCDDDHGQTVSTFAWESGGFNYRCNYGRSDLVVDFAPDNCADDYVWDEMSNGLYPEECVPTC